MGPSRSVARASTWSIRHVKKSSPTPLDDVRELMVTVHYPAQLGDGAHASAYADAQVTAAVAEAYHAPAFLMSLMHSHAVENAPCAKAA